MRAITVANPETRAILELWLQNHVPLIDHITVFLPEANDDLRAVCDRYGAEVIETRGECSPQSLDQQIAEYVSTWSGWYLRLDVHEFLPREVDPRRLADLGERNRVDFFWGHIRDRLGDGGKMAPLPTTSGGLWSRFPIETLVEWEIGKQTLDRVFLLRAPLHGRYSPHDSSAIAAPGNTPIAHFRWHIEFRSQAADRIDRFIASSDQQAHALLRLLGAYDAHQCIPWWYHVSEMELSWYAEPTPTDKVTSHTYMRVYDRYLRSRRTEPLHIVEIGVDKGGSLVMWRRCFPNARVTGVDIRDVPCVPGCQVFQGDSRNSDWVRTAFPPASIDVVIDDGDHSLESQIATFRAFEHAVRRGGIHFVEDIYSFADHYALRALTGRHKTTTFDFRDLKNRSDDVLVVIEFDD
jgi:hypothetical protein